jgi:hypothetical protein
MFHGSKYQYSIFKSLLHRNLDILSNYRQTQWSNIHRNLTCVTHHLMGLLHTYQKEKNRLLKVCYVPATSAT